MSSSLCPSFAPEIVEGEHWLTPADLLAYLNIQPGMTVADIAAGTGFYAIPIGLAVGLTGKVYAVEWRTWLTADLPGRVAAANTFGNICVTAGRAAHTALPAGSCDVVLLADIWHEFEHPEAVLEEARRILRPDGRLAILNWTPGTFSPPGPPLEHRVPLRTTLCMVENNSWSLVKSVESGRHGYLLVFEITDESVQS